MSDIEELPDTEHLLAGMRAHMPVASAPFLVEGRVGLVIVDEVNGFATAGAGNLAPPAQDDQVDRMVSETDRLASEFDDRGLPIAAFLDTHQSGKPEPPYPPHCETGTGEEDLVPAPRWLETGPGAALIRKDCINTKGP